jgi:hypothetical protein
MFRFATQDREDVRRDGEFPPKVPIGCCEGAGLIVNFNGGRQDRAIRLTRSLHFYEHAVRYVTKYYVPPVPASGSARCWFRERDRSNRSPHTARASSHIRSCILLDSPPGELCDGCSTGDRKNR